MTTSMTINPLNNNNNIANNENNNIVNDYFGIDECAINGGFEFADNWSRPYFKSAHQAISRCELWNFLRNFEPDSDRGFMFTRDVPELDRLNEEMYKDPINGGHSDASYGCTMRNMEFIEKHGYQAFKESYNK